MKKNWLIVFLLSVLSVCAGAYPMARTLELPAGEGIGSVSDGRDPNQRDVAIVGRDTRREITGKAVGYQKAVVTIEMITAKGRFAGCSGTLIAPDIVLTAGHCLSQEGNYHRAVQVVAVGLPPEEGIDVPDLRNSRNRGNGGAVQPKPAPQGAPGFKEQMGKLVRPGQPSRNDPSARQKGRTRPPQGQNSRKGQRHDFSSLFGKIKGQQLGNPKGQQPGSLKSLKLGTSLNRMQRRVEIEYEEQLASNVATDDEQLAHYAASAGGKGFPYATAIKLWVPEPYLRRTRTSKMVSPVFDYGLIFLDEPLGNKTGYLELGVKSDDELQNLEIFVTGRGGDKPLRSLWEASGRVGNIEKDSFFHNVDMVAGNSGGPIVDVNDSTKIIALNNIEVISEDERRNGERVREGRFPNIGTRLTQVVVNDIKRAMSQRNGHAL